MSFNAVLGSPGFELETALRDRLDAARRLDRFAPLTILVGSNLLGAYLKRTLAEKTGGLFNVSFETFAGVAAALAGGRDGPTLPPFADRVVVWDLVSSSDVSSRFGEAAKTRGFGEALLGTFSDLAEAGCTSEIARRLIGSGAAARRLSEMTRDVLSLYARFRERAESLGGDIQTLFLSALSNPVPPSFGRHVFVCGFYDFNEMQRRLLAHLARERDVTVFLPWGEGEEYRFARSASTLLEECGFEIPAPVPAGAGAGRAVRPRLMNASDEEQEIREIARMILSLAEKEDMRFGDVALVLPSAAAYVPLAREIFGEAGIPCYLRADSSAGRSPAAKGVLALLRMLGGSMERRDLVEFLVSAPLAPSESCAASVDRFSLWVRKSAEAGIAGERTWTGESAALVERLRSASRPDAEDREALAAALDVDALLAKIVRAREAISGLTAWRDLALTLSGLVEELFPESDERRSAQGEIESLAALDATGSPASFEAFARIAETALSGSGRIHGRIGGEGVNILTLAQARGLAFRAVFIPGLAERSFPTVIRQDPFLNDAERRELNACSGGALRLSEKLERLSEEALLFALARESAREHLVMSYPRFEEGTGKERIPSSFLRFIEGYSIGGALGDALVPEAVPRLTATARGALLLSEHELDFENVSSFLRGTGYLPDNAFFSRGGRLVRGRYGTRKFTPYDGVFSSREALGELRKSLEEDGMRFSPTYLETYAGCPFDYFLTRLLGITVLEEPERVISITPPQRGILIHRILARIFGELKKQGLLPVKDAPAAEVLAIAGRVTERLLEDFPKTDPVGLPVFWEMEKRLVRESVRLLLEEERVEEDEFVPAEFERAFGRTGDPLDVPYDIDGKTVHFRGRIDRLDTAAGGRFRVIDYKTGRLDGKDQDLARGSALQLPVYLLAASRILGIDLRSGEARYRHVGTGEGKSAVVFSGSAWDESSPLFAKIIGVITSGIERGIFFAPADVLECRNCDVRLACPAGAPRLFAIKAANDGRAREYLEMRGGGEEE
jgi:ATP-dependent helicase/nuclease subunit B